MNYIPIEIHVHISKFLQDDLNTYLSIFDLDNLLLFWVLLIQEKYPQFIKDKVKYPLNLTTKDIYCWIDRWKYQDFNNEYLGYRALNNRIQFIDTVEHGLYNEYFVVNDFIKLNPNEIDNLLMSKDVVTSLDTFKYLFEKEYNIDGYLQVNFYKSLSYNQIETAKYLYEINEDFDIEHFRIELRESPSKYLLETKKKTVDYIHELLELYHDEEYYYLLFNSMSDDINSKLLKNIARRFSSDLIAVNVNIKNRNKWGPANYQIDHIDYIIMGNILKVIIRFDIGCSINVSKYVTIGLSNHIQNKISRLLNFQQVGNYCIHGLGEYVDYMDYPIINLDKDNFNKMRIIQSRYFI